MAAEAVSPAASVWSAFAFPPFLQAHSRVVSRTCMRTPYLQGSAMHSGCASTSRAQQGAPDRGRLRLLRHLDKGGLAVAEKVTEVLLGIVIACCAPRLRQVKCGLAAGLLLHQRPDIAPRRHDGRWARHWRGHRTSLEPVASMAALRAVLVRACPVSPQGLGGRPAKSRGNGRKVLNSTQRSQAALGHPKSHSPGHPVQPHKFGGANQRAERVDTHISSSLHVLSPRADVLTGGDKGPRPTEWSAENQRHARAAATASPRHH